MPNIYDVAKRARVSVATVSAVLNDSAFVSADLKSRVQAAVAALGYQPNLLARSMARQKTQTLGMIVPDIANPFFPEVVRGAEDVAHGAGYTLLIASSDNDVAEGRGLPAAVPGEAGGRRHPDQGAGADAARASAARLRKPACRSCCSRARSPGSSPTPSSWTTRARPTTA